MGFPFEFVFSEDPAPVFIDKYYNVTDSAGLKMNHTDRRGNVNIFADALGGAWSDDDSDIEFVTLHAVEEHWLDLTYSEITEAWKKHINPPEIMQSVSSVHAAGPLANESAPGVPAVCLSRTEL
jgi:hypothetical protein